MGPIYLDHHATTPLDKRVLEAMVPFFIEKFGNAASRTHWYGREAEAAVEYARAQLAALIHADAKDIIFTSGATESDNLAIRGVAEFYREKGNHIITCQTEHRAVLDSCRALERAGFEVTYLPVDSNGMVDPDDVRRTIGDRTLLITIMFANHEIGTLHDVAAIGRVARNRGIFFHCDATQGVGKEPIDVNALGIDLLSMSAHKIYGPKGIGALYVRRRNPRVRLLPLIYGGGHERGIRSGTLNVPGIVGFGKACEIASVEMDSERERLGKFRKILQQSIQSRLEGARVNGHPVHRLAGNLNLSFADINGLNLLARLEKYLAISSGSACTSAVPEPSYILKAIGVPLPLMLATIRIGLGRFNTEQDVRSAGDWIVEAVEILLAQSRQKSTNLKQAGDSV
ncbi:MAG TPA: aminotransferase class V-fold PLP-dependent enzyme [Acidobacteriota bacterium]|jgi:cysteine desulfurase